MATKKPTKKAPAKAGAIAVPLIPDDERTSFRSVVAKWLRNVPVELSLERRVERLEAAMKSRNTLLDLIRDPNNALGVDRKHGDRVRFDELYEGGFSDLAILYLQTNECAVNLMLGMEALLVDFALIPTSSEVNREKAVNAAKASHANRKPNPEKDVAIKCKEENPELSATQIKTRCKLKAGVRTISGWVSAGS